jgi:peptidoglycan/xylan/chitin deacetylase (PgdA/CDA1 family)
VRVATIAPAALSVAVALAATGPMFRDGGIVRGGTDGKRIALEFTGHEFAEGGTRILDELAKRRAKASFFLSGDFLRRAEFAPLVARMVAEGHYVGPHSDKHLLYCAWDAGRKTLVKASIEER